MVLIALEKLCVLLSNSNLVFLSFFLSSSSSSFIFYDVGTFYTHDNLLFIINIVQLYLPVILNNCSLYFHKEWCKHFYLFLFYVCILQLINKLSVSLSVYTNYTFL